jgi:hypothetical protein
MGYGRESNPVKMQLFFLKKWFEKMQLETVETTQIACSFNSTIAHNFSDSQIQALTSSFVKNFLTVY